MAIFFIQKIRTKNIKHFLNNIYQLFFREREINVKNRDKILERIWSTFFSVCAFFTIIISNDHQLIVKINTIMLSHFSPA